MPEDGSPALDHPAPAAASTCIRIASACSSAALLSIPHLFAKSPPPPLSPFPIACMQACVPFPLLVPLQKLPALLRCLGPSLASRRRSLTAATTRSSRRMLERRLPAVARPRLPWPTLRGRWKLCRNPTIGRRGRCRAPQRTSRTQVLTTLRRPALGSRFAGRPPKSVSRCSRASMKIRSSTGSSRAY